MEKMESGSLDQKPPGQFVGRLRLETLAAYQSEPGVLREDEPHPVRLFQASANFRESPIVGTRLRTDEPLEIERVAHFCEF